MLGRVGRDRQDLQGVQPAGRKAAASRMNVQSLARKEPVGREDPALPGQGMGSELLLAETFLLASDVRTLAFAIVGLRLLENEKTILGMCLINS